MRALPLGCLLLLSAWGLAQSPPEPVAEPRAPIIGRVIQQDGTPVADAEVTGAWNPAVLRELAPAELATVRTDARGYFALPVPPATFVYLWALGPEAEGDARLATEVAVAAAGQRPELRTRAALRARARSTVGGLEGLAEQGPFTLRFAPTETVEFALSVPVATDGGFEYPPLPFGIITVELRGANDRILHLWRSSSTNSGSLTVPAVHKLPMRVTTPDGKPAAGVEILQVHSRYGGNTELGTNRQRSTTAPVAVTDAEGLAVALVASGNNPFEDGKGRSLTFIARKEGCADAHSGWLGTRFENGRFVEEENPPAELRFTMAPARPLSGRFAGADAAQLPRGIRIDWTSKVARGNGWTHVERNAFVPVDANGAFRIETLPLDAYALAVRAPVDGRLLLLDSLPEFPAQNLVLPVPGAKTIEVQVLDRSGGPACGATANLIRMIGTTGFAQDGATMPFALDPNGRARLRLPAPAADGANPGRWYLAVVDAESTALVEVPTENVPAELTLAMTPMTALRVRVVDAEGNPVAGATLQQTRSQFVGGPRSEEDKLLDILGTLTQQTMMRAVTDAEGTLVIRFVDRPWYRMQAKVVAGERSSEPFAVEAGDEVLQLKVQ